MDEQHRRMIWRMAQQARRQRQKKNGKKLLRLWVTPEQAVALRQHLLKLHWEQLTLEKQGKQGAGAIANASSAQRLVSGHSELVRAHSARPPARVMGFGQ